MTRDKATLLWKIFQIITDKDKPYLQKLIDDENVSGIDVGYKVFERLGDDSLEATRDRDALAIRLHVHQKSKWACALKSCIEEMESERGLEQPLDFRSMVRQDQKADRNYYHDFIQMVMDDLQLAGELGRDATLVFSRDTDILQTQHRNRSGASPAKPVTQTDGILQPGMSIGHKNRRAGTLGAVVFDRASGDPMLLSCWHVMATPDAIPGSRILHPGPSDGGLPESDWVGMLEQRGSLPSPFGDAAVARAMEQEITGRQLVRGQWGTDDGQGNPVVVEQTHHVTHADLGTRVIKSGKTTGVTTGIIDGVGIYFVDYGERERIPVHGFKIVPVEDHGHEISAPGDSGALWFRASDHVGLGLHFEGERNLAFDTEQAVACHLDVLLEALQVDLKQPS